MSLNIKMEKKIRVKNQLKNKLVKEGLTKNEKQLLNRLIKEAPIDYDGPERMEPGIEKKITDRETPYAEHPALPTGDRDFVELVSSKRFKDSVEKVRRYLGDTSMIQGSNPIMNLMGSVMNGMRQIMTIQSQNKETLEKLAVDLIIKELGIPEGSLQFDAQLIMAPMGAAQGMKKKSEDFDEDEIKDAFKEANDESDEHTEELEDFVDEFEKFNLEKAKRRLINSLIQGAAFKGGHMFVLVGEELNNIDSNLLNLYGVNQALMEHLYWLYPDMEGMAGSGGGQAGQSEVDEETDPPTVRAKAMTFPLLVHELVKGVYEVFGTHGLPDDPKQAEMVLGAEDTLPSEIWDSRIGPVFWEKFTETYPDELYDEGKKHLQHYLFFRFSKLNAKEFLEISKLILSGDKRGKDFIQRLVNEIVEELKQEDYDDAMGKYDDEDEDEGPDLGGLLGSLGIGMPTDDDDPMGV